MVADVETNRDILTQMLTRIGVSVRTASSGSEALELVRKEMPDVVFMDIRMPGMDGMETLRRLSEEHGRDATKVIAVTASVFAHQQQEFMQAGFRALLDKPLRMVQLHGVLAEHLGVEYETDPAGLESPLEQDWSQAALPHDLQQALLEAVSNHSITELRACLDRLETLGSDERALATHLRGLALKYDMTSVRAVLENVQTAS